MSAKPVVLSTAEWNTQAVKYLPPKVNDKGGKSINIISTQNNRALNISTPLLMTWGISDYVDEKGESDGKYSISLTFPNDDYKNANTETFLNKLKAFEEQVIDDAVKNSELWFGDSLNREVIKHMFFPILKYSKNKETKKVDYTKPPTIRAKVPNYGGKWNLEVYDTAMNLIFPCENSLITPMDVVSKMSSVACVLNMGQIWIGGRSFGVTIKLIQCVVKPRIVESVYGKCHIQLSQEEKVAIEAEPVRMPVPDEEEEAAVHAVKRTVTEVADSDDEDEPPVKKPTLTTEAVEPPTAPATTVPTPEIAPVPIPAPAEGAKKKIVKKKA